ncbi:MAG: NosD domain-containing protein [Candidatus Hodarchaeales archaeon]
MEVTKRSSSVMVLLIHLISFGIYFSSIDPSFQRSIEYTSEYNFRISRSSLKSNHMSIALSGDSDLDSMAISQGWVGNGSASNPYIIAGNIYNAEGENPVFSLQHSRKFLRIEDCTFSISDSYGLYLNNVSNFMILNSKITQVTGGMRILSSNNISIIDNSITDNGWSAISVRSSNNCSISGNLISSSRNGLFVENSKELEIFNNVFWENSRRGIFLLYSSHNDIFMNDFVYNNAESEGTQALDDGISNNFSKNYWNDWVEPDSNDDGLVDTPYTLEGSSNNQDAFPLAVPLHLSLEQIQTTSDLITEGNLSFPEIKRDSVNLQVGIPLLSLFLILTIYLHSKQKEP